jgi:hypothetical protein
MSVSVNNLTIRERVTLAADQLNDLTANGYIGIGRNFTWANSDLNIETPLQSIDYENQLRRQLVAIKKLYISNGSLVVRRVDWVANTNYDAFSESIEMYSTMQITNANGTVSVSNSTIITGNGTTFLLDYANNDLMVLPGDNIVITPQTREIINVINNTSLIVNSAFVGSFTANTPQLLEDFAPYYAKDFYVRNSYDQVFICLDNNFGSSSTDMPKISLGGQLPSNPYIIAADGYKWKYLYTISGGAKQAFFTSEWMPVSTDINAELAAVDGRLDIIRVLNGGRNYNNSAASFSAPILNVIGDGVGANLTAQVDANGTIYGVNVLNGGSGYTTAAITANTGANGANAVIVATIGPPGGWGANAAMDLGASSVMFSLNLNDTEEGTIPTIDAFGNFFTYRQISIIDSPTIAASGAVANSINYDLTYTIAIPANTAFSMNDTVYQSNTGIYANATFTATVVYFDVATNTLHINNTNGIFSGFSQLYGTKNPNVSPYTAVTAFSLNTPAIDLFGGELLFMENRAAVKRSPGQSENIKLIFQF